MRSRACAGSALASGARFVQAAPVWEGRRKWTIGSTIRRCLVFSLCVFAAGCATYAEPPPNYALTWAKRDVAFESFVADVDACNAKAEAAAKTVQWRKHDPAAYDAHPMVMFWRWLEYGADVDAAMAHAYDTCFRPLGYELIYVTEADAKAFKELHFAPTNGGEPLDKRRSRIRMTQFRFLHRLATVERPLLASIELHLQRRPLIVDVWPP